MIKKILELDKIVLNLVGLVSFQKYLTSNQYLRKNDVKKKDFRSKTQEYNLHIEIKLKR